ncbi:MULTISPECIES: hypothetical protein [Serratia]|uniref:CIS tube protein n=1 Tax=Serratia TaxID=613 RepID=UPI0018D62743|nr:MULTISPECIES: hypothetical protein [Serratia]MBH2988200.1 hypothetical protein [Serratia ureilytica]MBL0903938.1 hypothetical protein [Serratia bockelmannii]
MGLLERGLAKLTLEAYQDSSTQKKIGALTAMYNPESVNLDYAAKYETVAAINQRYGVSWYKQVLPPTLSLTLILDAQGPQGKLPVEQQLNNLRTLCFAVGERGEPSYLRVSWGSMNWHGHGYFSGRLLQLAIAYTLFDRNAKPLRATATLTLKAQTSDEMAKFSTSQKSTKQLLTMLDQTSLPQLLAQASVAAGSATYLTVAWENGADNLSGWAAGQKLLVR